MYVPDVFALTDQGRIADIMRRHDFATLVTIRDGVPFATHLPLLFDAARGVRGTLSGHMARANPQWRGFAAPDENGEVLAVFQGAHSYISPAWYGPESKSVPTWNYVAVHAYGRPRLLEDPREVRLLLERMVESQESRLEQPWSMARLEESYVAAMMRGIVCFEIPIDRIEAKAKLSQNKTPDMRARACGILAGGDADGRTMAELMAATLQAGA